MKTILARGGGNLNDPIFQSSNARDLRVRVDLICALPGSFSEEIARSLSTFTSIRTHSFRGPTGNCRHVKRFSSSGILLRFEGDTLIFGDYLFRCELLFHAKMDEIFPST